MTIEDLIFNLYYYQTCNAFDTKVLESLNTQVSKGYGFTEKQANLCLKIISRHKNKLNDYFKTDIQQYIDNPTYRTPIRQLSDRNIYAMSIIESEQFIKLIRVVFPYDQEIINDIREKKEKFTYAAWTNSAWEFSLDEKSLNFWYLNKHFQKFSLSEEIKDYFDQIKDIEKNYLNYVPYIDIENENFVFKNVSKYVKQPTTNNLTKTLFEAKLQGINVWDEQIQDLIEKENLSQFTIDFIKHNTNEKHKETSLNLKEDSLHELKDVIENISPIVFVIPTGSEYEKLVKSIDLLHNFNIKDKDISVLFRSESDKRVNQYIKENCLNGKLSNNTKAIFIMGKLPKILLEEFDISNISTVITFGRYQMHYTLINFLKINNNVIDIV